MKIYKLAQSDFKAKLISLIPLFCKAAQKVYDSWEQDVDGNDLELGSGGICQDIADQFTTVLSSNGINCGIASAEIGEQHVWTVAWEHDEKINDEYNAYSIDIYPSTYETGGGYNWKKIPGVIFDQNDIIIEKTEDGIVDYITNN